MFNLFQVRRGRGKALPVSAVTGWSCMKGNLMKSGFVLLGRGWMVAGVLFKNETFLPSGTSVVKWVTARVSYSSGQMGKLTAEKSLSRNFVFHGLLCLSGRRQVQSYSKSVIFKRHIYFRQTGGSFLKQDNLSKKSVFYNHLSSTMMLASHTHFFPLPFLTISEISASTWYPTAAPLSADLSRHF